MIRERIVAEAEKLARTQEGATTPAQVPAFPFIAVVWDSQTRSELPAGFVRASQQFRIHIYAKGKDARGQSESIANELILALIALPAWIRVRKTRGYRLPATDVFCTTIEGEAIEITNM